MSEKQNINPKLSPTKIKGQNKQTKSHERSFLQSNAPSNAPSNASSQFQMTKPEDILLNLKIIGCLKQQDRVSKNNDNILEIEANDWFQPLRRWWFSRSRNETINNIRKIIQHAFDFTDQTLDKERDQSKTETTFYTKTSNNAYFSEENSNLLQRFVLEMKNASKGLDNLKMTYNDDTRIVSEIDILREQLALRIEKINGILKIDIRGC